MKTKRTKLSLENAPEIPAKATATVIDAPTETEAEKVERISIPLTPNGTIAFDSIRQSTREKLKNILSNPDTAKNLGLSESQAAAVAKVEVFDEQWCGAIFDTIGRIESFAAQRMYKFPPEIADKAFSYSALEKEKLSGPMARVINKYAPTWFEQYKDEVALAMLFVTITAVKFQMAKTMMEMQAKVTKDVSPAPAPAPISLETKESIQ